MNTMYNDCEIKLRYLTGIEALTGLFDLFFEKFVYRNS